MNKLVIPPDLRSGDTITIIPTARAISAREIEDGIALAQSWGLDVRLGEGIDRKHFQQAGTEAERAGDLQAAINDPQVKAIWCARGGYGTVHLLDKVDLSPLRTDPKWLVGFSDVTVLHNALQDLGVASLHAQMPFNINEKTEACRTSLKRALFHGEMDIRTTRTVAKGMDQSFPKDRVGKCEGPLVGGNLSVLFSQRGTPNDIDPAGKILFLEDLDEHLYHVDRMVRNLVMGNWFKGLAGLVIGGMTDMVDKNPSDPFGHSAAEIIAEVVAPFDYPVAFGIPAGHLADNRAMILGKKATLNVTTDGATLSAGAEPGQGPDRD